MLVTGSLATYKCPLKNSLTEHLLVGRTSNPDINEYTFRTAGAEFQQYEKCI